MKKLLLVVALIVAVSASYAQSIIPKAGLSLSKIHGNDASGTDSKAGLTLGVGFNLPLGEGAFSIQPELNYIQKGFKASEDGGTAKLNLNYLELPVLVKASFGDVTKFYVNAGPSIAYGLSGKVSYEEGNMKFSSKVKFGDGDAEDIVYINNKIDLGVQFGGGVLIAGKVMVDVRYGLGLTKLSDDTEVKNGGFQFTVGLPISLK
ncbi:MAG TPA: porin family protein [Ohtaekwangia sp.]|uniref:porin family protein n=1 Tax=Ohtaekwangia sp. TaxID=2066019 RepID=UPI002F95A9F8